MYHLVFPAKYRRSVFDEDVDKVLEEVCLAIEDRYQVKFLEIGTDKDHVHSVNAIIESLVDKVTLLSDYGNSQRVKNCSNFTVSYGLNQNNKGKTSCIKNFSGHQLL